MISLLFWHSHNMAFSIHFSFSALACWPNRAKICSGVLAWYSESFDGFSSAKTAQRWSDCKSDMEVWLWSTMLNRKYCFWRDPVEQGNKNLFSWWPTGRPILCRQRRWRENTELAWPPPHSGPLNCVDGRGQPKDDTIRLDVGLASSS